ncbi:MAG: hypothetical protein LAQ30_08930 [Acidobacteriia bacterium]|nr:hypothetical protein [Terriglobia bacterium]
MFAVVMALQAIRRRRVMALYWVLASYFGLAILADMSAAPFGSAPGFIPALMTQDVIGRVSLFVLGCNVCFALGELVARMLLSVKANSFLTMTARDWHAGDVIWVYLGLFLMGCIFYLPQIAGFSYIEYAYDDRWLLSRQVFICSMPLGPLAVLRRRYWLAALPLAGTVAIVVMTHVRDPLLYSAFPLLIIILLSPWPRCRTARIGKRVVGVVVAATMLVGFGAYVVFLRTGTVRLPEFDLTRGMYLVFQRVDGGVQMTGTDSLEMAAKSLVWPVYNRHVTPNYSIPNDPPYYIARITTLYHSTGPVCHFPFLWYSDVYLSMGWFGMFQGVVWGALLGIWDAATRKNSVVWAVNLPFLTWTLYMFTRGVVGGSFSRVSPLVYTQLAILLAGFIWTERRMKNRADLQRPWPYGCGVRTTIRTTRC